LTGAYVAQGTVTITDISLEWVPFVAAGVAAAAWSAPASVRALRPIDGALGAVIIGALAMVAALFIAQSQFPRIAASEAQGAAQVLRTANKPLALDYARLALQLDGSRPEYWATFAGVLSDFGNSGAAGSAFQEAAQRQPWSPLYWRDLAITYIARNDEPHAIQYLERAISSDPFDVSSHDLLARLAYNKGDWQRAFDEGALAVRILPSNQDLYDAPVRAAIPLKRLSDAESMLRTGIAQHETAHLHVLLAVIYSSSGRRPEALAELDKALTLAPGDTDAQQLRQQVLAQ
jgi:tetratricopeptide (TPR) repeat protein